MDVLAETAGARETLAAATGRLASSEARRDAAAAPEIRAHPFPTVSKFSSLCVSHNLSTTSRG